MRNIVDIYRSAGFETCVAGVLSSEQYEPEDGFVSCPNRRALSSVIADPYLMEDYSIGKLFHENEHFYGCLLKCIRHNFDVIHVEQPWLISFAKKMLIERGSSAKLIYGSQNIEWSLKKSIIRPYFDYNTVEKYANLILQTELDAVSKSDAVVAVSEEDRIWLKSLTSKTVVLAPNGVSSWNSTLSAKANAKKITGIHTYALFCGSMHMPNINGFFKIFGDGFGSLKSDERLVVAGGAGLAIRNDIRLANSSKLSEKIVITGVVDQSILHGLIDNSKCIVLPITQGGGTNLKTAEALWSGKNIITTTKAMRGFEFFASRSNVYIADTSASFKKALRVAMNEPLHEASELEKENLNLLLWPNMLKSLIDLVHKFS